MCVCKLGHVNVSFPSHHVPPSSLSALQSASRLPHFFRFFFFFRCARASRCLCSGASASMCARLCMYARVCLCVRACVSGHIVSTLPLFLPFFLFEFVLHVPRQLFLILLVSTMLKEAENGKTDKQRNSNIN